MKALWTEDEASDHGRPVDFEPVLDRVLDFGDEWLPEPRPSSPPSGS